MPSLAHWPLRYPMQPAAALITLRPELRSVSESATPAVQRFRLTAGSGTHPARSAGIGLVLRPQPRSCAAQARCSLRAPQRLSQAQTHSLTPLRSALHFIRCAPRCSSWRSGVSPLFAFGTLYPHCTDLRSRHHRPSTSPEHKISAELTPAEILSHKHQRY